MHIQTPTRIMYINGIKNIRLYLESKKPEWIKQGFDKSTVQYATAIAPGVLMTPFSSILEASNAGHMNPESLALRCTRGLIPRTLREVIFAIGLNEVSDYCQAAVPAQLENKVVRNVVGSITAGVLAGYVSHVPHNLSTLKLLKPQLSYAQHFGSLVKTAIESRFKQPDSLVYRSRPVYSLLGASIVFALPRGVIIRSMQIAGSFVLVNGAILLFNSVNLDAKARDYAQTILYAPAPVVPSQKA